MNGSVFHGPAEISSWFCALDILGLTWKNSPEQMLKGLSGPVIEEERKQRAREADAKPPEGTTTRFIPE